MQAICAKIIGTIFLIIGIWGFFTTALMGLFDVNGLQSFIHFATGIAGIATGFWFFGEYARGFNIVAGISYFLFAVIGLFQIYAFNEMFALNTADNFLHLGLALVCGGIGLAGSD